MSTIVVHYYLSEESRKDVFVTTGTKLERSQTVELDMAEATPAQRAEILRLAGLDLTELWKLAGKTPVYDKAPSIEQIAAECRRQADERDAAAYTQYATDRDRRIEWIKKHLENRDPAGQYLQLENRPAAEHAGVDLSEYDRLYAEYQAAQPGFAAERQAQDAAREEAKQRAAKQVEDEKRSWIENNGSDFLKRACVEHGYDCQRRYVTERAALEVPGFVVDFDNNAEWRSRSCPSDAALTTLELSEDAGYRAEVVWLTTPPHDKNDEPDYGFEPGEAVAIRGYLGKYDLVRKL